MTLRVTNLRLPVERPEADLPQLIARRLGVRRDDLQRWRILRKSLDARSKHDLQFVYSAAVDLPEEERLLRKPRLKSVVDAFVPKGFDDPPAGETPLAERPLVVGAGPAGLLAAYYLALRGYQPLIIDRGQPVKERVPVIRAFAHYRPWPAG